jgi:predicted nucleotidyltransferase
VGYEVVRYDVPEDVAGISATEIRAKKKSGDDTWKAMVPPQVATIIG